MNPESVTLIQNASYLVITGLVCLTLYTVLNPLLEGDKLKKRMNSVSSARNDMRKARLTELNNDKGLRSENKGVVRDLVDRLSLEKLLEATNLKDKLAQAGLRGQRPIYTFYFFRFLLPALGSVSYTHLTLPTILLV